MNMEKRTILIVDGSTTMLFYHEMLLKRLEYHVVTARSGEDAIRTMEAGLPTIVMTDIPLPRMNGVQLLKRIKDSPGLKAVPVVMLSSDTDPGIKDTCLRLGCAAYLTRPVEPELLYRTIQSVSETTPRMNIRLATSLKAVVGDSTLLGGATRTEYATAISEGGCYIRTLYPQPQNALTPVRVFVNNHEIKAKAVVLYSYARNEGPFEEAGMGMKFIDISENDKLVIRDFIREQLTRDASHN